jgi:hypothetical protein
MSEACIISIIYEEPEWEETERLVSEIDAPLFFVDRQGVGSLARAINAGFKAFGKDFEYCWFVTNVTFRPTCFPRLLEEMKTGKWAGLTPAFNSDHTFCQPGEGVRDVPFIEFTAPLVRSDVFSDYPLDEKMPYWGHDLDWGYRVKKAKHKLGCLSDEQIGHTYIRNSENHQITKKRKALRNKTNSDTTKALIEKHGKNWRRKLKWPS